MQLSHSIHCTAVGQSLVRRSRNIIGSIVAMLLLLNLPATAQQQTVTFTSSGTFTVPPGVTSITVHCIGGGGGGGTFGSMTGYAGGGGGGGYAKKVITVNPLINSYPVTVGQGGAAGTNGGDSWFSTALTVKGAGGKGGTSKTTSSGSSITTGGNGGQDNIGDMVNVGGSGAAGNSSYGGGGGGGAAGSTAAGRTPTNATGGLSTSNWGGAGGNGKANSSEGSGTAANTTNGYGGGGGGAYNYGSSTWTGGSGANGVVIIEYTSAIPNKSWTAAGTYNDLKLPAGVASLVAEAWGGGGGGSNRSGAAGGGGGGAYAAGEFTGLTSGATVSVSVGAGGSAGSSGGNSTVASGSQTMTANSGKAVLNSRAGGAGGAASSISGPVRISYAGGKGGNAAIYDDDPNKEAGGGGGGSAYTNTNGTNGANGGSSTRSSTSGGAGTGDGGAGGAADGSPDATVGMAPGGGGGGRGEGSSSSKSGAPGRVNLYWTCPTYSITSIASSRVCTINQASTITITTTQTADLPAGTYTVSYDLTDAQDVTTSHTVSMTVVETNGQSVGSFTTVALGALGAYELEITSLLSGDVTNGVTCSNTPANNKVSIVYVGSQPTDHFQTKAAGAFNQVTTWASSPDGSTWCDATIIPGGSAASVTILHDASITTTTTVSDLTVPAGTTLTALAHLTVTDALSIIGTLDLSNGRTLDVSGATLTLSAPIVLSARQPKGNQLSTAGVIVGDETTTLNVNVNSMVLPPIQNGVGDLNIANNTAVLLGSDLTVFDDVNVGNGASLSFNGYALTLGDAMTKNGSGSYIGGVGSSLILSAGSNAFDAPAITNGIGTLVLNRHASLGANTSVLTSLQIASGSELRIGNHTLTFNGSSMSSTGTITTGGSNTNSILHLLGSNGSIDLPAVTDVATIVMNRPSGTINLSSNLEMKGSLTVTSGTLNLGSNNIILKGVLTVGQNGQITGTGSVIPRQNNGKSKLVNAKLKKLVLDNGDADVEGTLTIGDQGSIDFSASTAGNLVLLSDAVIDLGTTGSIIGETSTKRVTGSGLSKIRSQRTINNGTADFGLGVVMSSTGNLGAPIVDRYFDHVTSNGASSIKRRVVWSNFNASNDPITMSITYTPDELNGLSENDLVLFVRNRTSSVWSKVSNSVKVGNTITGEFTFTTLPSFAPENGSQQSRFIQSTGEGEGTAGDGFSALPVELVSFSGMMRNEKVQLAWKTATETNNYGFEVERAAVADPKASVENAQWSTIGFVAGNGTTSSERSYSFSDDVSAGALQQVSHFAYRLRQIDRDGTTDYSPVVFVSRSAEEPVALALDMPYPNPASSESFATVRLAESRIATVQLVSVDGKVLETIAADQQLDAGVHSFRISRGTLPAGVYFVVVQSADLRVVRPLTIVR